MFSFLQLYRNNSIAFHCFFCCVTNNNSCSDRNIPLPPPQPAGLRYWGWLTSIPLKYFPQSQLILPHFVFILVYFLSLLVLRVGADPPPLPLCRREGMGVGLLSESLQKLYCLPRDSPCMHAFFKSQGDIMKLGLESSSLPGAFLETLPPIFILLHFHLNYTEHILEIWLQL